VNTKVTVVEGSITKTVASESSVNPGDFDFANIMEAFDWINSISTQSEIRLSLDDGLHYHKNVSIENLKKLEISSISGNRENCILTIKPGETDAFVIYFSSYTVRLIGITFDAIAGGQPLTNSSGSVFLISNSGWVQNCEFKNGWTGLNTFGTTYVTDSNFSNTTAASITCSSGALRLSGTSKIHDTSVGLDTSIFTFTKIYSGVVFENAPTPIRLNMCCSVLDAGAIYTNSPMNIQPNKLNSANSILFTEVAWTGTTAERPTLTAANERSYFDTTLGKPIWYNGADWVDAVGTVV